MPAAAVLRPAQEDVASRLHEPVPLHYPLPVVGINARARIGFQDRGARFLDLEEEGVLCTAISSATLQTVPTLPTPTTLMALSLRAYRSRRTRRSSGNDSR